METELQNPHFLFGSHFKTERERERNSFRFLAVGVLCFFFKQKTAYEISACLVGSEMCIRDSPYPAWFFLNRVSRVWVTRSIPAPLSGSEPPRQRTRYPDPNRSANGYCSSWTANSCDGWVEPLQRFRPNCCNYSLGSDPLAPPGAL